MVDCACDGHCPASHDPAQILDQAIEAVLASVDMAVVLDRTGKLLRRYFGPTRVAIHRVIDDDPEHVEVLFLDDPAAPKATPGQRVPLAGTPSAAALASGRPCALAGLRVEQPRFAGEAELALAGYGALAAFPLRFEGRALGTLEIAHPPRDCLLEACMRSAEQVARLLGIALHNSMMVGEVQRLNQLLDRENTQLRAEIQRVRGERRYVAESPLMRDLLGRVSLVAPTETTVLLRGETGTGKEGLARMVHELSPRRPGPFVTVNLGAIPDTLIESELFGHERGAFTGAAQRKPGRFEQAAGGTIFLDEVGDAPPSVQVRLLRVLQERELQRVGGTASVPVDVRVVAATNRPLEQMVADGSFRSDLYYRLNAFPLLVPPLRERREDIGPLASYFLARCAERMHRRPPQLTADALATLAAHGWPGNVRELENYIERSLILSPGAALVLTELPGEVGTPAARAAEARAVPRFETGVRALLRQALAASDGKIYGADGAAALLGLPPTTLQGKLRRYGLKRG